MFCNSCKSKSLSDYASKLNFEVQARYLDKIKCISADPYVLKECRFECWRSAVQQVPKLEFLDVYEYFVLRKSYYSREEFLAFKGLEAYDFFVSGHLKQIRWIVVNKNENQYLFSCLCKHSMRSNEDDLILWLLLTKSKIVTAHCTCMAGLDECCSHVGALTFFINYASTKDEDQSVTSQLAYWVAPSKSCNKATPKQLSKIDLTTPKRKLEGTQATEREMKLKTIPPPLDNEQKWVSICHDLKKFSPNNANMYAHKELQKETTPKGVKRKHFAKDITVLKNLQNRISKCTEEGAKETSNNNLNVAKDSIPAVIIAFVESQKLLEGASVNLLKECPTHEITFFNKYVNVDSTGAQLIFKNTIEQCTLEWHKQRQVRITASKAYELYTYSKTTGKKPKDWPKKLEGIVFDNFKGTAATDYGKKTEKLACEVLKSRYSLICDTGLLVPIHCPWYACSSDALMQRTDGIFQLIEIKCPVLGQTCSGVQLCQQLKYLKIEGENFTLKKKHIYYGQIQLGLFTHNLKMAKFVIFSTFDSSAVEINVPYDQDFVTDMIEKLNVMYFSEFLPFLCSNEDRLYISKDAYLKK